MSARTGTGTGHGCHTPSTDLITRTWILDEIEALLPQRVDCVHDRDLRGVHDILKPLTVATGTDLSIHLKALIDEVPRWRDDATIPPRPTESMANLPHLDRALATPEEML
ncbi:MAG: hypothetical protein QF921_11790 [Pseudomonadales bacterium]|jgi:hypothetical protein|nr:hypothetical protein [Pseudomonadales bacterium]MDP6470538.1 hypothetical protein [Pseudomonadales bacterium]MDP6827840.1 hypothetical protein [Pseudomonadales bacterium]MDP6972172.1 hypothetical protein [Pseudomonadales bacterium]|tara:strand:- start:408 stop:737 length:330 start_codon:yes stop_codon:yes gene_type:complete